MAIVTLDNGMWFNTEHIEKAQKFERKLVKAISYMNWGVHHDRRLKNHDCRKLAIITIGQTQKYAWIDPDHPEVAFKGYYSPTWMQYKKFTFIRWATTFDM